jgi:hypothetical protein
MLVICADCTSLISSKTLKCPHCGHENVLLEPRIFAAPRFGSIEKQLQSEQLERLVLTAVVGIFGAGMLTALIMIIHQVTADLILPK